MKTISRFLNKILVRYLLSYLVVLMLPLLTFSLFNEQYFVLLYRNEIFEQNMLMLNNAATQMKMHFDEMNAMPIQLSSNAIIERDNLITSGPRYFEIKVLLRGLLGSRPFYSYQGAFYTFQTPEIVYTPEGTFSPNYYQTFLRNGEQITLPEYCAQIESPQWVFPENPGGSLLRIMPIPYYDRGYLLLSIPQKSFSTLTATTQGQTFLFDNTGVQIYPLEAMEEPLLAELQMEKQMDGYRKLSSGRFALYSDVSITEVRCVRVMDSNDILSSVTDLQDKYRLVLMVLLSVSGVLIYVLAFVTHRPIKELDEYVSKTVEIPKHLHGAQKASFLIQTMEKHVDVLTKQNRVEKLLLQLLYSRVNNGVQLEAECAAAGMDCFAEEYRILLVALGGKPALSFSFSALMEQIFGDAFSFYSMEYPDPHNLLVLLGYSKASAFILNDKLSVIADRLSDEMGYPVRIAVGSSSEMLGEVSASYLHAVSVSKRNLERTEDAVVCYEVQPDRKNRFIYPKLELDALYAALLNVDVERVRFMSEVLEETVRSSELNKFTQTSLCFDILKCYVRAGEDLHEERFSKPVVQFEQFYSSAEPEPEELLKVIAALPASFSESVQKYNRLPGKEEKSDDTAAPILAYINEHWRDSELCVSSVADHFSLSLSNLSHRFKLQTGQNISSYIAEKKLIYAKELLAITNMTLAEISELVGYKQTTSFIRKFKQLVNMTPSEYRELHTDRFNMENIPE